MRKIVFFLVALVGLLVLVGLLFLRVQEKKEATENRKTLPDFTLHQLSGEPFTQKDVLKDRPLVIFYFNSECEHCQYEAIHFLSEQEKFDNAQVLWVSDEPAEVIQTFAEKYPLKVIWLSSKQDAFYQAFGVGMIPSVLIYEQTGKLVKLFKGETKVEAITQHLP